MAVLVVALEIHIVAVAVDDHMGLLPEVLAHQDDILEIEEEIVLENSCAAAVDMAAAENVILEVRNRIPVGVIGNDLQMVAVERKT